MVTLRGVVKRFGDRLAVGGVDLDVPHGSCFGLLGPNGAGKTTTLRMVYGVTRPSAGEIRVFGIDVAREPRRVRSRLGVTLQENSLIEPLSPEDNLRIFGRYHPLREPALSRRVSELMDFLELRSHAGVPVRRIGFEGSAISGALPAVDDGVEQARVEVAGAVREVGRLQLWVHRDQLTRVQQRVAEVCHRLLKLKVKEQHPASVQVEPRQLARLRHAHPTHRQHAVQATAVHTDVP